MRGEASWSRLTFILLLGACLPACDCGSATLDCKSSSDCPRGELCRSGLCQPASSNDAGAAFPDGGDIAWLDAGEPCAQPCGTLCCTMGEVCEGNACHLDCGTKARCGASGAEACCAAGELCYRAACIVPGVPCGTQGECPAGQYCEPTLDHCLPRGQTTCIYRPPAEQFNPDSLWRYTVTTDLYRQVMMTPIVLDATGDGVPEVFASFFQSSDYSIGVVRGLSGEDGELLWTSSDKVVASASLAGAILEPGGSAVVLAIGHATTSSGALLALDARTGVRRWASHDAAGQDVTCAAHWGGAAIADLDGDGNAEVLCGLKAFDHQGKLLWDHGLGGGSVGPLTLVADLDNDGRPELTDGGAARHGDGQAFWEGSAAPGFPATGDFLGPAGPAPDGLPELAVVTDGKLSVVNGQTGQVLLGPVPLPSWDGAQCVAGGGNPGNGGPPTVADFDADGLPEIGVADLDCYSVYEVASIQPDQGLRLLWTRKVQDHSSSVTGSSVFDFEGDGAAEVVYADEVRLHVFRGKDGVEVFGRDHCSGTTYEYPVIADVNGNGRADIIIPENNYASGTLHCAASITPGIQVFKDANDNWVNTRAIWNQHTYHVTNVCDGRDRVCGGAGAADNVYGRVPRHEPPNWAFTHSASGGEPLNNYRQNVQGEGLFDAPDLALEQIWSDTADCPDKLEIAARVTNLGSMGIAAGLRVTFYLDESPRRRLGVAQTTTRLLPGDSEVVTLTLQPAPISEEPLKIVVVVDDTGSGQGEVSECKEDNNELGPVEVPACPSGPS
ncbi:MAG: PQQ-binding-like beta-propeller repeat protein [Deltaproteobacteria bacterium]|nr:PQQ-binding-like beta-propeller repeat protein [Deltaproteobacteria bacterium]